MSRSRVLAAGAVAVVATGLLSGCGVSDAQVRPGLAAQVGDVEITIDEVDDTVGNLCEFIAANPDPQGGQQRVTRTAFKSQLLTVLIRRAVAEQVLDDTGAEISDIYATNVAALDDNLKTIEDADQRAALQVLNEAGIYTEAALDGVGRDALADSGVTDPGLDQITESSNRIFTEWVGDHEIDVNPLFDVAVTDGSIGPVDSAEVSVAVSDFAVSVSGDDPAAASADLPDSLACG